VWRRVLVVVSAVGCTFHGAESNVVTPGDGGPVDAPDSIDASVDAPRSIDAPASLADLVIEAEAFSSTTKPGAPAWMLKTDVAGYSGTGFMELGPGTGAACTDTTILATCAASMTYQISIAAAATYHFQVRMFATTTAEDSLWYGLDGVVVTTAIDAPDDGMWDWITGATLQLTPGNHAITLWQRESGARVDRLALTTSATPPP